MSDLSFVCVCVCVPNDFLCFSFSVFYEEDRVQRYTSAKRMNFSHIPIVRRELLHKKRREKKLTWMQKMYREGMSMSSDKPPLPPLPGDKPFSQEKLPAEADSIVVDDLDFMEEEELLAWSESLNFDEYYSDWVKQSCSNGSEVSLSTASLFLVVLRLTLGFSHTFSRLAALFSQTSVPLPTKEYNKKATIQSFGSFQERENFEEEEAV